MFLYLEILISEGFANFSCSLEPKTHMVSFWDGIDLGSMCLLNLSNFFHRGQWLNSDQILDCLKHHRNKGMLSFSRIMFQIV